MEVQVTGTHSTLIIAVCTSSHALVIYILMCSLVALLWEAIKGRHDGRLSLAPPVTFKFLNPSSQAGRQKQVFEENVTIARFSM